MKPVHPPRHPATPEADTSGATRASRATAHEPPLPHEHDESSHSQASATPQHDEIGRKAYDNATDGSADTDRGPLMDQLYNDKVTPARGPDKPRR